MSSYTNQRKNNSKQKALATLWILSCILALIVTSYFGTVNRSSDSFLNNAATIENTSGKYAFFSEDAGSLPQRWCTTDNPIHYEDRPEYVIPYYVDYTGLDRLGFDREKVFAILEESFAKWEDASQGSYTFEYAGEKPLPTVDNMYLVDLEQLPPHSIGITFAADKRSGWADYTLSALGDGKELGDIVAVTSNNSPLTNLFNSDTKNVIKSSVIVMDALAFKEKRESFPLKIGEKVLDYYMKWFWQRTFMHEIGHVLGLAHIKNTKSIMFPSWDAPSRLSRGDKEGVAVLSRMPCSAEGW